MDPIKIILENQLTLETAADLVELLSDHDALIRSMARYVLEGKAGTSAERAALLGSYAEEVQEKVNWTIKAAENVWAGMYGTGDARKEALGADYELVMFRVNQTATVTVPAGYKYSTDNGGKRYVLKDFPTARGKMTWYGYDQHNQGTNPFVFDGSGCGFCSALAVIATLRGYNVLPLRYATDYLKTVAGANKCPISTMAMLKLLDHEKIKYDWVRSFGTASAYNDILLHLRNGMPVMVHLFKDNRAGKEDKRYTRYAHYAVLIGVTSNGKGYLLDSSGKRPRFVDLYDLCDHIPTAKDKPDWSPNWNGNKNCGGYVKVYM